MFVLILFHEYKVTLFHLTHPSISCSICILFALEFHQLISLSLGSSSLWVSCDNLGNFVLGYIHT